MSGSALLVRSPQRRVRSRGRRRPLSGADHAALDRCEPVVLGREVAHLDRLAVWVDGDVAPGAQARVVAEWASRHGVVPELYAVRPPTSVSAGRPGSPVSLASRYVNAVAMHLYRDGVASEWDVLHGARAERAFAERATAADDDVLSLVVVPYRPRRGTRLPDPVARFVASAGDDPVALVPVAVAPARRRRRLRVGLMPHRHRPTPRSPPTDQPRWGGAVAALLAALAIAASSVTVPYVSVGPGSVYALRPLVRVSGAPTYPPAGEVLVATVHARRLALGSYLWSIFGSGDDVRTARDAPPGGTARLMAESQRVASAVALTHLGRPVAFEPSGGLTGPVAVQIDLDGVGGASAGFAFALSVVDLLSPGELTGGRVVAATGVLDPDGRVNAVSGADHKARAARRAGAVLFVVPAASYHDALRGAGAMPVVGVETVAEAIASLVRLGGDPVPVDTLAS